MTTLYVKPSKLGGQVIAPPSKSHSLRAILFASFARGRSEVSNVLASPDVAAMIKACRQLGARIKEKGDKLVIDGVAGKPKTPDGPIDAGNSGQVLRFVGALASLCDGEVQITGDHSIQTNRPVRPLMNGLEQMGVVATSKRGDGFAPLSICGSPRHHSITIDGADSQPVSALLMLAAFIDGVTEINVENAGEKPWVGLTLSWFDRLGINYTEQNLEYFTVTGGRVPDGFIYKVPGDFSSIAFAIAAALVTGADITIAGVDMDDAQGDKHLIKVLQKMGAVITHDKADQTLKVSGAAPLKGTTLDINDYIDSLPILAVVGCFASGEMRLTNCAIARAKESDRLAAMAVELTKMGAEIEVGDDFMAIRRSSLSGAELDGHHDHRIVMALCVASLAMDTGTSTISDVDCVGKSYPEFIEHFRALGAQFKVQT
jgi:3-phosphoshikimate 1-carboxyvinyltransferase